MDNYSRIADSLTWLAEHYLEQPTLAELAARAQLSESHFQKVFTQWAGVSPKKFLQCLTLDHARKALDSSESVFDASLSAGLSGPSRLHDLFVTIDAVSPGEYKNGGAGLEIDYAWHETPFGPALLMLSHRGVTTLSFQQNKSRDVDLHNAIARLPNAQYRNNPHTTRGYVDKIFQPSHKRDSELPLLLAGTEFQLLVWRALIEIPEGACATYSQVAQGIGRVRAHRAVGTAIGKNPIAYLIPCHRVIQQTGLLGNYRWGVGRKLGLLGLERLRSEIEFGPDRAMI